MKDIFYNIDGEFQLDKAKWTKVKFGTVAIQQKKSVDREKTDLTFYVKGEHMGSQDLHLREWGELKDEYLGPAFIRYFEKDDILYGSRRTYLRKVVIAPFEGITSNTTLVIKANEKIIDKLFLPFVMMSEGFTDHSIKNSKGSVNPYINWKDLANYEFLLPPKEEQRRLAELLWTLDEVIEKEKFLKRQANMQYEVAKSRLVLEGFKNETTFNNLIKREVANGWKVTTVGKLLSEKYIMKIQDGNHGELHPKSSDYVPIGIPFIMANTLVDGIIDLEKSMRLPEDITNKLRIGFSYSGDVLLSHKGTVGQVAMIPDKIEYPYLMLTPQVTFYRTNPEKLLNKFLYYVFNAKYFQNQITRLSSQSTRAYVGITSQRDFKLAIPNSIDEQIEIVNILSLIENNRKDIDQKIFTSQSLQKSLINQIF
ncbi:restriction endonuclease subunit S [Pedobacter sp. WC2423]|uniref:restriction endonuclease subunit S n=1 Tax=Pedobacter sp. WC2423 TaxID=3234142 RepID=UPI003467C0C5